MNDRQSRSAALVVVAATVLLAGCSNSATSTSTSTSTSWSESSTTGSQITVYAASSLTGTFTEIGKQFEAAHPGTTVRLNFAGSADLVSQLQQGAPADIFASADAANMNKAVAADLVAGAPREFATNSMTIAVPPDNPANITGFPDLAKPGVQVVVCAPAVPCGAATQQVEVNTGVTLTPVSEESAATDVLNKVATGEADAGIVYVTDAKGPDGTVNGIAIPAKDNAVNTYPIAVLAGSASPTLAEEFEAMVVGADGQQVLADAGFGAP